MYSIKKFFITTVVMGALVISAGAVHAEVSSSQQTRLSAITSLMKIAQDYPQYQAQILPLLGQAIQAIAQESNYQPAQLLPAVKAQTSAANVTATASLNVPAPSTGNTTCPASSIVHGALDADCVKAISQRAERPAQLPGGGTASENTEPCEDGTKPPCDDDPTGGLHIGSDIDIYVVSGHSLVEFHRPLGVDNYDFPTIVLAEIIDLIDQAQPNYTAAQIASRIWHLQYHQS